MYNTKGKILVIQKKFEKALECFSKAIELNKKEPAYYNNKGVLLTKLKKYDEASEFLDDAIKLFAEKKDFILLKQINSIERQLFETRKDLQQLKHTENNLLNEREQIINLIDYQINIPNL